MESDARVLVLTRENCPLCDAAIATVAAVCAELDVTWTTADVDADEQTRRRWTDEVPVTFIDGVQHDHWRVDRDRFRAALQA